MFKDIYTYMKLSRDERKKHLKLENDCLEIGGKSSTEFKGLLAYHLKTSIPNDKEIMLCHGCGNSKCSNPDHLYWGTRSDNEQDKKLHGTFLTRREITIRKYGVEKANEIYKNASSKGGKKGGGSNKLSKEEIQRRLELISDIDLSKYGANSKVSKRLNITHTQAKRFLEKYMPS